MVRLPPAVLPDVGRTRAARGGIYQALFKNWCRATPSVRRQQAPEGVQQHDEQEQEIPRQQARPEKRQRPRCDGITCNREPARQALRQRPHPGD